MLWGKGIVRGLRPHGKPLIVVKGSQYELRVGHQSRRQAVHTTKRSRGRRHHWQHPTNGPQYDSSKNILAEILCVSRHTNSARLASSRTTHALHHPLRTGKRDAPGEDIVAHGTRLGICSLSLSSGGVSFKFSDGG